MSRPKPGLPAATSGGSGFTHETAFFTFLFVRPVTGQGHETGDEIAFIEHVRRSMAETAEITAGRPVNTIGPGRPGILAFSVPSHAVQAAIAIQTEAVGAGRTNVAAAMHSGEVAVVDGEFYGIALAICSRLAALARPGQVLMSSVTASLLAPPEEPSWELRGLGSFGLRGISQPVTVMQVVAPGLPSDFPPLEASKPSIPGLPKYLSTFIGRGAEIDRLVKAIRHERLVTVIAPGGTGKTRLVAEVAPMLVADFPNGIWWLDLSDGADPEYFRSRLAHALQVDATPDNWFSAVLAKLQGAPSLLVFDNCESALQATADFVPDLLAELPDLRIVVTSRLPLEIEAESVWRLPPLTGPGANQDSDSDSSSRSEVELLLLDRAKLRDANFTIRPADRGAANQLFAQLAGNPLAIELAAARLQILSIKELSVRLTDSFSVLRIRSGLGSVRQASLDQIVEWSYANLSTRERHVLEVLSFFPAGLTAPDLSTAAGHRPDAVRSGDRLDSSDRHLRSLSDKGLVTTTSETDQARYVVPPVLRAYGRERARAAGRDVPSLDALLRHVAALAARAESGLESDRQADYLKQLTAEHQNIRAGLVWAASGGSVELGMRAVGGLRRYWEIRRRFVEARPLIEKLLETDEAVSPDAEAVARLTLGSMAYLADDLDTARAEWLRAGTLFEQTGDERRLSFVLNNLGHLERMVGSLEEAERLLSHSLALKQTLGDPNAAVTLLNLGLIALERGKLAESRDLVTKAADIHDQDTNPWSHSRCAHVLAEIAIKAGDYSAAEEHIQRALEIRKQIGDPGLTAESSNELARLRLFNGDIDEAESLATAALKRSAELGSRYHEIQCLFVLSLVARLRGATELARDRNRSALRIALKIGERRVVAHCQVQMARADLDSQRLSLAEDRLRKALQVFAASGHHIALPILFSLIGVLRLRSHDVAGGGRFLGAADAIAADQGSCLGPVDEDWLASAIDDWPEEPEFETAFEEGRRWSLDQAISEAMTVLAHPIADEADPAEIELVESLVALEDAFLEDDPKAGD